LGKAAGERSGPLTPSSAEVKECVELYLNSRSTPSWRGAQSKKKAQGELYLYLRLPRCATHLLYVQFR